MVNGRQTQASEPPPRYNGNISLNCSRDRGLWPTSSSVFSKQSGPASVPQNSSGLKLSKFRTGSDLIYSHHHNCSLSHFPYICAMVALLSLSLSLSYIHYNHSFRICTTYRFRMDRFSWKCLFEHLFFRKSVEKFQVSIKSDTNNWCIIWRPIYIFDHILLNSS